MSSAADKESKVVSVEKSSCSVEGERPSSEGNREEEMAASSAKPTTPSEGPSESERPIRLVMAADEDFAMPMATTLFSVLRHLPSGQGIRITALDAGVTGKSKGRVTQIARRASPRARLNWTRPDTSMIEGVDVEMDPRFSRAIFYRLLIPEVLPEEAGCALYLDSDLVLERSILPLWKKPFEGHAILAVPERIVSCRKAGVAEWERLGLDPGAWFFNSGLMVMNLKAWREEDIHVQTIDYLLNPENDFCYASDQEALNAVLADRWGALDQRWNAIQQVFDSDLRTRHEVMLGTSLEPAQEEPFVIHYTSDEKPWLPGCTHPRRDRFYHYLRESGWFSEPEYLQWRAWLSAGSGVKWLKDKSRPLRHKIGLQRA